MLAVVDVPSRTTITGLPARVAASFAREVADFAGAEGTVRASGAAVVVTMRRNADRLAALGVYTSAAFTAQMHGLAVTYQVRGLVDQGQQIVFTFALR